MIFLCMYVYMPHVIIKDVPTVVGSNHYSDKMTTTTNSLTDIKISACLVLLATLIVHSKHITSVNKEPSHNLSINIKDH